MTVKFSNDDKIILSQSNDDSIRVWNTSTWSQIEIFQETNEIMGAELLYSQNMIVYATNEASIGKIHLIDLSSMKVEDTLDLSNMVSTHWNKKIENRIFAVNDVKNYTVAGNLDLVVIWDLTQKTIIDEIIMENEKGPDNNYDLAFTRSITFDENGDYLAWSSFYGNVVVWDIATKSVYQEFNMAIPFGIFMNYGTTLTFSLDSTYLAVAFNDRVDGDPYAAIKIWNVDSGILVETIEYNVDNISELVFSDDGKYLVVSHTNTVEFIQTTGWTSEYTISYSDTGVTDISSDNQYIIAGNKNGQIRVWKYEEIITTSDTNQKTSDMKTSDTGTSDQASTAGSTKTDGTSIGGSENGGDDFTQYLRPVIAFLAVAIIIGFFYIKFNSTSNKAKRAAKRKAKQELVTQQQKELSERRITARQNIAKEKVDQFRKISARTSKIEVGQLAQLLKMNENELLLWLYDLPEEFGFKIDTNMVDFESFSIDDHIDDLMNSFMEFEEKKEGKVD